MKELSEEGLTRTLLLYFGKEKGETFMSNAVKETMCANCIHRNVCKNCTEYLKVVEACDRIKISFEDGSISYVKDIDWIENITPVCKNYLLYTSSKPVYR